MSKSPTIPRPWNTKEQGLVEFLVYYDRPRKRHVGVCLTFDIVEEGDDPEELMQGLEDAAKLHVEVVRSKNLPDELLNRHAPQEYWGKYFNVQSSVLLQDKLKRQLSPSSVNSFSAMSYPVASSRNRVAV